MTVRSEWHGHKIILRGENWFYIDSEEAVASNPSRACKHCGKDATPEGHDGCLGTLPGVMNACCGHGIDEEAHIQFMDGSNLRGVAAIIKQDALLGDT